VSARRLRGRRETPAGARLGALHTRTGSSRRPRSCRSRRTVR
jgi:hypothetical protein